MGGGRGTTAVGGGSEAADCPDNTSDEEEDGPEADYERPSGARRKPQADAKPVDLLPFKTADGALLYDKSRSRAAAMAVAAAVPGVSVTDDLHESEASLPRATTTAAKEDHVEEKETRDRPAATAKCVLPHISSTGGPLSPGVCFYPSRRLAQESVPLL